MKTHGLTIKIKAKTPKNVRNCESWVSALPVISLVLLQAALDDCARDWLVVDTLRDRVNASEGNPGERRNQPETRPRNLMMHVQRIPPGSEARSGKGLDWCAIVHAFDIWLWEASQFLRRVIIFGFALQACAAFIVRWRES